MFPCKYEYLFGTWSALLTTTRSFISISQSCKFCAWLPEVQRACHRFFGTWHAFLEPIATRALPSPKASKKKKSSCPTSQPVPAGLLPPIRQSPAPPRAAQGLDVAVHHLLTMEILQGRLRGTQSRHTRALREPLWEATRKICDIQVGFPSLG